MTEERKTTFLSHQRQISAGECVYICARPQIPLLEPYKLFIPKHIAENVTIDDVRVGNRSMYPAGQSVPAEQFSHGDGHPFKCEPIHLAQDFIMMVTNICGHMVTFRASWACYLPREVDLNAALQEQDSGWFDLIGRTYRRAQDIKEAVQEKVEEKIQEFKDKVEAKLQPRFKALPKPKPKDPPGFGWDPGYGDD